MKNHSLLRALTKPGMLKAMPHVLVGGAKKTLKGELIPLVASFDIASACNLRCQTCYIYRDEEIKWEFNKREKMSFEEWETRIKQVKEENPHLFQATWVGGEPLTRPDVLRMGTSYFPLNWIVTNGTVRFPEDLNHATYFLSLDGPEEYHNFLRDKDGAFRSRGGVFNSALKNVSETDARVYSHSVITTHNQEGIEELVEQIHDTNLRGIKFSFYTPENGAKLNGTGSACGTSVGPQVNSSSRSLRVLQISPEDPLYLGPRERDQVVERIHKLKDDYGEFIRMTSREIDQFLSTNQSKVFGSNCILPYTARAYDFEGALKEPCVMGPEADCDRCGCTIPPVVEGLVDLDVESFKYLVETWLD